MNQIYTGDSRELSKRIPDESVDFILTDPVYQNIDDYAWLAQTAARILKPGGNLLAYAGHVQQIACINAMSPYLDARPILTTWMSPPYPRLWAYKMHVNYSFVLWFAKHGKPVTWIVGEFGQAYQRKNFGHEWGKNFGAIKYYIQSFTGENAVVFDPFSGGGTTPIACKELCRNFLAFEINEDTAQKARKRLYEMPEMLPFIYHDSFQGKLFDGIETQQNKRFAPDRERRAETLVAKN